MKVAAFYTVSDFDEFVRALRPSPNLLRSQAVNAARLGVIQAMIAGSCGALAALNNGDFERATLLLEECEKILLYEPTKCPG